MTREERAAADPTTLPTPELILRLVDIADPKFAAAAEEGFVRAARLQELEAQCAPGRNDYAGITPDKLMALVNAPSPPTETPDGGQR